MFIVTCKISVRLMSGALSWLTDVTTGCTDVSYIMAKVLKSAMMKKHLVCDFLLVSDCNPVIFQTGAVLVLRNQEDGRRDHPTVTLPPKPRPESTVRKSGVGTKGAAGQEGEFPCKKCGR